MEANTRPIFVFVMFFGVLLALALAAHVAQGQESAACLACHGSVIDPGKFSASVHGSVGCSACHADIKGFPHPQKVAAPNCATCHGKAVADHEQSIHGGMAAQETKQAAGCKNCHGDVHIVVSRSAASSPVHRSNLAETCARCHGDGKVAEGFRIPVVRPADAYLESVHAKAIAAGQSGASCSDCHGFHTIRSSQDPQSLVWRRNVPSTCGQCHQEVLDTYLQSVHGAALDQGVREAPVCTDCHGEHRILAPTEPSSPVFAANIPGQTCSRCHASARLSEKYGLPLDKVPAFQDSYHGLALRTGLLTAANCASCHGVHDIRPSSDPRSHIHPANLPQTCGQCHPGAGTRFTLGPVHVRPAYDAAPVLFWIRIVYLWIICLGVGLMALHNILDLLRKARRQEAPPRSEEGLKLERMPRVLRWQHGLVMLSFPILVYTGFALTYPESWWAAPLLHWETQLGLRGWLHRAAACVLMGSLLWHLIYLVWSGPLRQKLAGLKPKVHDLYDFINLQRYNLGWDSERPRFGKFSYIEKIEYWAFLWGTAIMTLTGLLLWFENLSLRYLPKWASDVATAIHFYEAILATLAILVWHFYWVIFDPEVYPMDRAWWHGRSPAGRVLERSRPEGSTIAQQRAGSAPSDQKPPDESGTTRAYEGEDEQTGEED